MGFEICSSSPTTVSSTIEGPRRIAMMLRWQEWLWAKRDWSQREDTHICTYSIYIYILRHLSRSITTSQDHIIYVAPKLYQRWCIMIWSICAVQGGSVPLKAASLNRPMALMHSQQVPLRKKNFVCWGCFCKLCFRNEYITRMFGKCEVMEDVWEMIFGLNTTDQVFGCFCSCNIYLYMSDNILFPIL